MQKAFNLRSCVEEWPHYALEALTDLSTLCTAPREKQAIATVAKLYLRWIQDEKPCLADWHRAVLAEEFCQNMDAACAYAKQAGALNALGSLAANYFCYADFGGEFFQAQAFRFTEEARSYALPVAA